MQFVDVFLGERVLPERGVILQGRHPDRECVLIAFQRFFAPCRSAQLLGLEEEPPRSDHLRVAFRLADVQVVREVAQADVTLVKENEEVSLQAFLHCRVILIFRPQGNGLLAEGDVIFLAIELC